MNRPDFIIIGAMKCATSTLHDQLAAQPGVFMSSPKEPNFFSDDEVYRRGIDWYSSLFDDAPPHAIKGESSTHYTKRPTHPKTVERLIDFAPGVKTIYLMRHPIDRLVSQYMHEWTQNVVRDPIDEALRTFPPLIEYSRYAMQLKPYLEAFGPERVLPVFLNRLRARPQAEFERIARFIGFDRRPVWRDDRAPQNVSEQRVRKSPWRDRLIYAPGVSQLRRRLVPRAARERIKSFWRMKDRPELSQASRRRLVEIFDEDLAELGQWLGLPLSCEAFDELADQSQLPWRGWAVDRSPRVPAAQAGCERGSQDQV